MKTLGKYLYKTHKQWIKHCGEIAFSTVVLLSSFIPSAGNFTHRVVT